MFESYVPKLTERIYRLLEDEAKCFEGWEVRDLEGELAKDYPEISALLVGLWTALAPPERQYAIIRLQETVHTPSEEYVFPDAEGNQGALQMAAYILVWRSRGKTDSPARYWSIEDGRRPGMSYGPDAAARKDYDEALGPTFEGYMRDTAVTVAKRGFSPAAPEKPGLRGLRLASRLPRPIRHGVRMSHEKRRTVRTRTQQAPSGSGKTASWPREPESVQEDRPGGALPRSGNYRDGARRPAPSWFSAFTRKAAAEMYGRIHRELLEVRRSSGTGTGGSVLRIPDIHIGLLLLASSSARGPGLRVSAGFCRGRRRIAADWRKPKPWLSFLSAARRRISRRFSRAWDSKTAWKDLFADAAARLWTPSGTPDIPAMRKLQRMPCRPKPDTGRGIKGKADRLAAEEAKPLVELREGKPAQRPRKATAVLGDLCKNLDDLTTDGTVRRLSAVAGLDLKGYGKSDSDARIKEAVKAARECARNLLDTMYMEEQAPLAEAVLGLIAELGERVRKAKRLARVMGFHDVAAAAVDLLQRRTDVREYWKRRFRFVMIDEFQDNNELQKDLLYLLAEREGRSSPGIPGKDDLLSPKSSSSWATRSRASIGSGG
jgi:hypothetical protein